MNPPTTPPDGLADQETGLGYWVKERSKAHLERLKMFTRNEFVAHLIDEANYDRERALLNKIGLDAMVDEGFQAGAMRHAHDKEHAALLITALQQQVAALGKYKARLTWLHAGGERDAEGCEWGIFRVRWDVKGRPEEVWQTLSDFSDLDAEMAREAPPAQPNAGGEEKP